MMSTEFSYGKVKRKLRDDGLVDTLVAAGDLLTRKRLGRPVFDRLVERQLVRTTSRAELRATALRTVPVATPTDEDGDPFVALVGEGRILSETGLVLTDRFGIVEESAAEPPQAQQAMMAMLSRELFYGDVPVRRLLGRRISSGKGETLDTAASLVPRYPDNYYHWMVETVPKIRYLRTFEDATGREVTVLVPADPPPFVAETLRLLNWPESQIAYATEPVYDVRELVVPSYPERHASDFEWIQRDILSAAAESDLDPVEDEPNVYISRSDAVERRVRNEDAVMRVLSDYGFERYQLEDRPLADNARLFDQADVVVGPHGAGLTDIIFAGDCTLLELFGAKVKQPYELLADAVGVAYEPMYCTAEGADIVVDTQDLEHRVSRLTGQDRGNGTARHGE